MANIIKTLEDNNGNTIIPRTMGRAVTMEDGTSLEFALKNRSAGDVKLTGSTATSLGVEDGTSLSEYLETVLPSGVVATAELV